METACPVKKGMAKIERVIPGKELPFTDINGAEAYGRARAMEAAAAVMDTEPARAAGADDLEREEEDNTPIVISDGVSSVTITFAQYRSITEQVLEQMAERRNTELCFTDIAMAGQVSDEEGFDRSEPVGASPAAGMHLYEETDMPEEMPVMDEGYSYEEGPVEDVEEGSDAYDQSGQETPAPAQERTDRTGHVLNGEGQAVRKGKAAPASGTRAAVKGKQASKSRHASRGPRSVQQGPGRADAVKGHEKPEGRARGAAPGRSAAPAAENTGRSRKAGPHAQGRADTAPAVGTGEPAKSGPIHRESANIPQRNDMPVQTQAVRQPAGYVPAAPEQAYVQPAQELRREAAPPAGGRQERGVIPVPVPEGIRAHNVPVMPEDGFGRKSLDERLRDASKSDSADRMVEKAAAVTSLSGRDTSFVNRAGDRLVFASVFDAEQGMKIPRAYINGREVDAQGASRFIKDVLKDVHPKVEKNMHLLLDSAVRNPEISRGALERQSEENSRKTAERAGKDRNSGQDR